MKNLLSVLVPLTELRSHQQFAQQVLAVMSELFLDVDALHYFAFDRSSGHFRLLAAEDKTLKVQSSIELTWSFAQKFFFDESTRLASGLYLNVFNQDPVGVVQRNVLPHQPLYKTLYALPFIVGGEIQAFVVAYYRQVPLDLGDLPLQEITWIRQLVEGQLTNLQELQSLRKEAHLAETLDRILQVVNQQQDLDVVLSSLLQHVSEVLPPTDIGTFLVLNEQTGLYDFKAVKGYDPKFFARIHFTEAQVHERYLQGAAFLAQGIYLIAPRERAHAGRFKGIQLAESLLVMTFYTEGNLAAVLLCGTLNHPLTLDASDITVASRFRDHLTTAIQKLRFIEQIRLNQQELHTLDHIVRSVNQARNLSELLPTFLKQGLTLIPKAQKAGLLLYDAENKVFKVSVVIGYEKHRLDSVVISWRSLLREYLRSGQLVADGVVLIADATSRDREQAYADTDWLQPKSTLAMVVEVDGHIEGIAIFDNLDERDAFRNTNLETIKRYKKHVDNAFEKVRLSDVSRKQKKQIEKTILTIQEQNEELKALNELMVVKSRDLTDSIHYAKRIQEAIQPKVQDIQLFLSNLFVFYEPRDIVSGDFFWFSFVKDRLILVCADCTGHGVPGAFMSVMGTTLLNQIVNVQGVVHPASILTLLNKEVKAILKQNNTSDRSNREDGIEMGIVCLDLNKRVMQFAGANRPLYYYNRKNQTIESIKGDKKPVGGSTPGSNHLYLSHELYSKYTGPYYLTTDGIIDQFGGPDGRKFLNSRLLTTLNSIHALDFQEQHERIRQVFLDWKGYFEQVDDILLMGFDFDRT
jgi:serine phosphatase RsbU (regulator of sigma subunit)